MIMDWEQYEEIKAWEEEARKFNSEEELEYFIRYTTPYAIFCTLKGEDSIEKAKILWDQWHPNPHQEMIDEWEASNRTKIVQILDEDRGYWETVAGNPVWAPDGKYRFKPEPELMPFDFSDVNFLIGKSVRIKSDGRTRLITAINEHSVYAYDLISYQKLFDLYEFLDGTPCGKLKE